MGSEASASGSASGAVSGAGGGGAGLGRARMGCANLLRAYAFMSMSAESSTGSADFA